MGMEEFERTCDDTDAPVTLRRSRPPSRDVEISLEEEGSPGGSRTRRMWGLARRLLKRWRVSRSRSESPGQLTLLVPESSLLSGPRSRSSSASTIPA